MSKLIICICICIYSWEGYGKEKQVSVFYTCVYENTSCLKNSDWVLDNF